MHRVLISISCPTEVELALALSTNTGYRIRYRKLYTKSKSNFYNVSGGESGYDSKPVICMYYVLQYAGYLNLNLILKN